MSFENCYKNYKTFFQMTICTRKMKTMDLNGVSNYQLRKKNILIIASYNDKALAKNLGAI